MANQAHPEVTDAERLEALARQQQAFEMIDLVERFRAKQALIAKQVEARDSALTMFCVRVDLSLVMLQTLTEFIGRKSKSPGLKRATDLLMSELEDLERNLKEVLQACIETLGEGGER
ncbi:hypothetical protein [Pseudomonas kurunegalensis]|uniref:hypothetical protein n=1 Tax=Pseudomonas kurunegalensis TaxID=485880 RepID=UPI002118C330|nr:hypothetical protein [Pseudomonas kurunegalensis]